MNAGQRRGEAIRSLLEILKPVKMVSYFETVILQTAARIFPQIVIRYCTWGKYGRDARRIQSAIQNFYGSTRLGVVHIDHRRRGAFAGVRSI